MIDTLNYEKVPVNFTYCFNGACKLADTCLRYQVSRHIPETKRSVRTLNLSYIKTEESCSEFMSDVPVKYAYGWGHMFDKLIHEKAVAIKDVMYNSKRGVLYLVVEKQGVTRGGGSLLFNACCHHYSYFIFLQQDITPCFSWLYRNGWWQWQHFLKTLL